MSDCIKVERAFVVQAVEEFKTQFPTWSEQNAATIEHAMDAVISGWVRWTGSPHRFCVQSNSTAGASYIVDRQTKTCTCPWFNPKKVCSHRIEVHFATTAWKYKMEFVDWQTKFDTWIVTQTTDEELDAYQKLQGLDIAKALRACDAVEAHQEAIREMGGRLPA